jgi:hypothetical protein
VSETVPFSGAWNHEHGGYPSTTKLNLMATSREKPLWIGMVAYAFDEARLVWKEKQPINGIGRDFPDRRCWFDGENVSPDCGTYAVDRREMIYDAVLRP